MNTTQSFSTSFLEEKGVRDGLCYVSAVANYFIERSKIDDVVLTNLSMQKLVYFAYGWTMGHTGKKLFYDRIEAWQYGPVIPTLYHQLKQYGSKRITKKLLEYDYDKDLFFSWNITKGTAIRKLMWYVWQRYKSFPPNRMVTITHNPGTPWSDTIERNGYMAEITDKLIYDHFSKLVHEANEGTSR